MDNQSRERNRRYRRIATKLLKRRAGPWWLAWPRDTDTIDAALPSRSRGAPARGGRRGYMTINIFNFGSEGIAWTLATKKNETSYMSYMVQWNGLKMKSNKTQCILFATKNFNKRTETFQKTIDDTVKPKNWECYSTVAFLLSITSNHCAPC